MLPLHELQGWIARTVISGELERLPPALRARLEPNRLELHARHYVHSLATALADKFPTTQWLIGNATLRAAASAYVRTEPPCRPCIAEYGGTFPAFLAQQPQFDGLPYLGELAALEWLVGKAAIAVTGPPLTWNSLNAMGVDRLLDQQLLLQPGVFYLPVNWPVDTLLQHFLDGAAAAIPALTVMPLHLEISGARGTFAIRRLAPGEFHFRRALAAGATLGIAAESGLDHDPGFDTGAALRRLVQAGLPLQFQMESPGDSR